MTPEEITMLFATASDSFQPVVGQPTDNDLTAIRELLYPLLLDIPYDEAGAHNLMDYSSPPHRTQQRGETRSRSRPIHRRTPLCPTKPPPWSTPAVKPNTPYSSRTLQPTRLPNEPLPSSSAMLSTKSGTATSAMPDPSTPTSQPSN
jgi:hypothetical protein